MAHNVDSAHKEELYTEERLYRQNFKNEILRGLKISDSAICQFGLTSLYRQDRHRESSTEAGPEVLKHFSCSTQLSMKFSPLINVKMPTIVGKNSILGLSEPKNVEFLDIFILMSI